MPVVFEGSAVVSTQRQQVGVNAGIVWNQQHREVAVIRHDEDHLEAVLFQMVFQPLVTRVKVEVPIMCLTEKIGGDAATGAFF